MGRFHRADRRSDQDQLNGVTESRWDFLTGRSRSIQKAHAIIKEKNTNAAIDPETGYNDEETKVIKETRKIFEDEQIAIGVTCVRVPVLRAHCEAITFECEKPITEHEVRAILANAPGVRIVDDRAKNYFPMPIDASGQDDVLVGRIRKDLSDASGHSISMFVSADQLLKGAALNAIQIAELLPQRVMA